MSYSKSLTTLFVAVVCSVALSADAGQRGGGHSGGSSARAGTAAPRASGGVAPRGGAVAPYRGGYGSPYGGYRGYYPYRYGPGLGLGLYGGFGYPYYYGYGYGGYPYYYGYGYGYPYPYAYGYPYTYGPAPDPGYVTAAPGYDTGAPPTATAPGYTPGYAPQQQQAPPAAPVAFGSLQIDGAPRGGEVFADGYDIGPIDKNGALERVDLPAGPHKVEIRMQGQSSIVVNVSVRPGETTKFRATAR
jgi:hypothetical protein